MKKVIRAAVMALAVILLAASCSKTASNTLALLGSWELIRSDVSTSVIEDFFRCSEFMKCFQHRTVSAGLILHSRIQFPVGKCSCSAFSELDIGI